MIATRKHVESHIQDITPDMLGLATKVYDFQLKANIYLVESTSGATDEDGNPEEYRVSYTPGRGFSCTCKSGQYAFANVRHASGVCTHCRIACAAAAEERAKETARLARATAIALAHSCGMEICSTDDCLQLAGPSGKCVGHTGTITDKGMQAWMADRATGRDINLGRPAWMMR